MDEDYSVFDLINDCAKETDMEAVQEDGIIKVKPKEREDEV